MQREATKLLLSWNQAASEYGARCLMLDNVEIYSSSSSTTRITIINNQDCHVFPMKYLSSNAPLAPFQFGIAISEENGRPIAPRREADERRTRKR